MNTQNDDNPNAPATMAPATIAPAAMARRTIVPLPRLPEYIDVLEMAADTILIYEAMENIEFRKQIDCGIAAVRLHSASMAYALHFLVNDDTTSWLDFEEAVCKKFGCCDLWDVGIIPALVNAAFDKSAYSYADIAGCFADIVRECVEEAS